MWIDEINHDHDRGLAALTEELARYGGSVTVTHQPTEASSSQGVNLFLPEDEYRAHKCREILREWHQAQS